MFLSQGNHRLHHEQPVIEMFIGHHDLVVLKPGQGVGRAAGRWCPEPSSCACQSRCRFPGWEPKTADASTLRQFATRWGSGLPLPISLFLVLLLLCGLSLLWLELRHRLRPASPLRLLPGPFQVKRKAQGLELSGEITIRNPHGRMEVFVPEISVQPVLLGRADLTEVRSEVRITPLHPDEEARPDHYWAAYIVKAHKSTAAQLRINLIGPAGTDLEGLIDTVWLDIQWINYGPFGRLWRRDGILVPVQKPEPTPAAIATVAKSAKTPRAAMVRSVIAVPARVAARPGCARIEHRHGDGHAAGVRELERDLERGACHERPGEIDEHEV